MPCMKLETEGSRIKKINNRAMIKYKSNKK
jgi:hypothetical protein